MPKALAACVALTCAVAASLSAEETGEIKVGARVRLTAPPTASRPLVGTIESLSPETIGVRVKGQADRIAVARSAITRLEMSRGRGTGKGMAVGAAAGAALGSVVTVAACTTATESPTGEGGCDPGLTAIALSAAVSLLELSSAQSLVRASDGGKSLSITSALASPPRSRLAEAWLRRLSSDGETGLDWPAAERGHEPDKRLS